MAEGTNIGIVRRIVNALGDVLMKEERPVERAVVRNLSGVGLLDRRAVAITPLIPNTALRILVTLLCQESLTSNFLIDPQGRVLAKEPFERSQRLVRVSPNEPRQVALVLETSGLSSP